MKVTVGISEAKAHFSKISTNVNKQGIPVTVFKHNKPWVEIRPLSPAVNDLPDETIEAIAEVQALKADPAHETHRTAEELFEALGI